MRKNLTEVAASSDLIPGIYNYCDRWCERCQFTGRCLVFVENEDAELFEQNVDNNNAVFWSKLAQAFDEAQLLLASLVPPTSLKSNHGRSDKAKNKKALQTRNAEKHYLTQGGREYAAAAARWFSEMPDFKVSFETGHELDGKQSEDFRDATEVIQWYQYQIAVKVLRALSSRAREGSPDEYADEDSLPRDSDGSAKVALVGIDRSISAWRMIQNAFDVSSDTVIPLLLQLDRLRRRIEAEFPSARDFVRPGFDEMPVELINDE